MSESQSEPVAGVGIHAVSNGFVLHEYRRDGSEVTSVHGSMAALLAAVASREARFDRERPKPKTLSKHISEALDEAGEAFGVDSATLKGFAMERLAGWFLGTPAVVPPPRPWPSTPPGPVPGPGFTVRPGRSENPA